MFQESCSQWTLLPLCSFGLADNCDNVYTSCHWFQLRSQTSELQIFWSFRKRTKTSFLIYKRTKDCFSLIFTYQIYIKGEGTKSF
jgi:hypothetical protein